MYAKLTIHQSSGQDIGNRNTSNIVFFSTEENDAYDNTSDACLRVSLTNLRDLNFIVCLLFLSGICGKERKREIGEET